MVWHPLELLDTYWEERQPIAAAVVQNSILVGETVQRLRAMREKKRADSATAGDAAAGSTKTKSRKEGLAGLGGDFSLMASKLKQRTDACKPYPRLEGDRGRTRLTGESFPQPRVRRLGSALARRLDDAAAGSRSTPAFVLFAVSCDGAAPALSEASSAFFKSLGGSVFRLALDPDAVAPGCEYHSVEDDSIAERYLKQSAPFAALARPDRIVLGAVHLEHAEALVEELRRYLSGDLVSSKL